MASDQQAFLARAVSAAKRALVDCSTLEEAAPRLLESLAAALRADLGELWLVDPRRNVLTRLSSWSRTTAGPLDGERTLAPGEEPAGRAWRAGRSLVDLAPADVSAGTPFRSTVSVPMIGDAGTVGVLALHVDGEPPLLSPEDLEALSDLARQCGQVVARRQAEEALLFSEERYRTLVLSLAVGVIVLDAAGDIETVNPAAERILGRRALHCLGRQPSELGLRFFAEDGSPLPPDDLPSAVTRREGTPSNDVVIGVETPGERRRWISVTTEQLRRPGASSEAAVLVSFLDVTDRRLLEEQLRQSQKMEALGQLAGSVAHDFNNLLTPILGYSEAIQLRAEPGSPLHEDLDEIRKAGERAAALTRQLLAFSRSQPVEPVLVDVNAVVTGLEKLLGHLAGPSVELRVRLAPVPGHVRADPGLLGQVLMNLVVNARDAMPDGGTLTIETLEVELEDDYTRHHLDVAPGPYVLISVSDTGTGMEPDVLPRIFEPFFTTKEPGRGTGLGLSTVYGIVKQSGGHIGVYSEPGRGSVFKVYLPCGEDRGVSARPSPPAERGAETILLVEDEESTRTFAARTLRASGYQVLEAASGEEALAVAAAHWNPIHLLLTDAVMPGMTGPGLAEELTGQLPELKVIFMSGFSDGALPGMDGTAFLEKPFSPAHLVARVREAIGARPLSSPPPSGTSGASTAPT